MSTIVIRIDGTDITDDVVFKQASFQSMVNGSPGPARLRVKDVGQTYEFNPGDSLTLDVDAVRVWGGYVLSAKKIYALSVIDTTPHYPLTRMWEITGVDYNILFDKRIIWKESDPTGKIDWKYDADTYDDTIINDIFDNYVSIGGDGLTRTGVERIAKAILDVPGKTHHGSVASASFTWKEMMNRVARATGGVYYISPTKVLTYVDVETATSSYDLTDTPAGGNDIGYQSFTLLENGSDLVNDMMVWGAGTGSNSTVFSRTEDAASVTAHNRWQLGLFTSGLYRQASADIIADSYVYGTPQSHRGGKDDAITFSCRVFEPIFAAGQVVDVSCGIFDYTDALPIRSLTTTFASPTEALFDLVLGHVIDLPVGITEFKNYIYNPPDIGIDEFPCPPGWPRINGQCVPPEIGPGECECGITDTFTRTAGSWGTSDAGVPWVYVFGAAGASADGSVGIATDSGSGFRARLFSSLIPQTVSLTIQFMFPTSTNGFLDLNVYDGSTTQTIAGYSPDSGGFWYLGWEGDPAPTSGVAFSPTVGVWYNARLELELNVEVRTKVWAVGDTEPAWTTKATSGQVWNPVSPRLSVSVFENGGSFTMHFDNLDILGIDRCTAVQFDDFNRTVASPGLGVATNGTPWTNKSGTASVSVDGDEAVFTSSTTTQSRVLQWNDDELLSEVPWLDSTPALRSTTMRMRWRFNFAVPGAGAGFVRLNFSPGNGPDCFVDISSTQGDYNMSSASPGTVSKLDWVSGQIYISEWVFDATTSETSFFVYEEGSAPGTPCVTTTTPGDTRFELSYFNESTSGTARPIFIDSIDFDYDGKPCYTDCALTDGTYTIFDNFSRTNSVWGTSSSGYPWQLSKSATQAAATTNGSLGLLTITATGSQRFAQVTINPAFSPVLNVTLPWNLAIDIDHLTLSATGTLLFQFYNSLSGSAVSLTELLFDATKTRLYTTQYSGRDAGGMYDDGPAISSATTLYISGTSSSVTVAYGATSLSQPWRDLNIDGHVISANANPFNRIMFQLVDTASSEFGVDAIHLQDMATWGTFICSDGPEAGSGIALSGPVCETLAHSGGPTFTTTQAFYQGTLEVWVNGIQNPPASSDGAAGEFELGDEITSGDTVRVCYNANGDPV